MTDRFTDMIAARFPLTEKPCGEYSEMKVSGMRFLVRRFTAEGLGNVSVMKASGFLGLMKMDTLIINPTERDMPLLSYDRVLAMGNDTMLFELCDTLTGPVELDALDGIKKDAQALPDYDPGTHWYDYLRLPQSLFKKGRKQSEAFNACAEAYLEQFLAIAANAPACPADSKLEKAGVYVEGLLSNGGPSTDVFKKSIGEEKTAELFRKILFATRP